MTLTSAHIATHAAVIREPNTEEREGSEEGSEAREEAAYKQHVHAPSDTLIMKYCNRNMLSFS